MKRTFALLFVLLLTVLAVGGASAVWPIDSNEHAVAFGTTSRGYLLSADDVAYYSIYYPQGMTIRPRITVDPASPLRLAARLDTYPTPLIDDSCDDAVIEFEHLNTDNSAPTLAVWPCPGQLDVDTPYFIHIGYDLPLTEVEPNGSNSTALRPYYRLEFMDFSGAINPAGDTDFYWFNVSEPGQHVTITMTTTGGSLVPGLHINGPSVGWDTEGCNGDTSVACLDVIAPNTGDYFLSARSVSGQGSYNLSIDFPDTPKGDKGPNDTPEEWAFMWGTTTNFAAIDPVGDVDHYFLASVYAPPWETSGDQGRILRVTLNFGPEFALPHVAADVLDPNGAVVLSDVLSADHPSFDFTVPNTPYGRYVLRLSDADDGAGDPDAVYYTGAVQWVGPFVSSDLNGLGGRYARQQGDLLVREGDNKGWYWSLIFDASDVGITQDVTAAEFLPNGTLLLALGGAQTVPGLGKVMPQDVIRFVPAPYGLGGDTAGVFEWYLDGSDVGLTAAGEKIDAIALSSTDPDDFALVLSLSGSGSVPKAGGGVLAVGDEDQIRLTDGLLGANSAGTWTMHQDGSVAGLGPEDVSGLTLLSAPATANARGDALFILRESFNFGGGVSGDSRDVLLARQGWPTDELSPFGLLWNNLGDKKLDAITVGPVLDEY